MPSTDKCRLDPIKYVDISAPDFYKEFDSFDIPIISIYIKVKNDFLVFYYLWVNEQGVLINDSNYIDTIGLTYGAFQGYKSSKYPSFGVYFNKVKITRKKGETIRANIVFTPLYLMADDVIGSYIPRKIIYIGEKSGVGYEWAKLAALDFWLSIKTKQKDESKISGSPAIFTLISAGAILLAAGFAAFSSIRTQLNKIAPIKLTLTIRNYLDSCLCISAMFIVDDIHKTRSPILRSGETDIFPYSKSKNLDKTQLIDIIVIYNVTELNEGNFFRFCIENAGGNKSIRLKEITEYKSGQIIGL
ncbi:hypothetical protein CS369_05285 [Candidatus Symbiopectobacterium sp. 'North America']|uniref:hypothetical protein n=1 Tax=Candidatus Symbiopectobacterium sp. 'North America' TaxID=2794574 RepID=UPI0018CA6800|nr:hypothetical protein [Candidatus Symbiopectobacterium sp. 'North America']MBG6244383.1 hypothetical protein [Candidatus Symbiopectobacterium sp. 'North America']